LPELVLAVVHFHALSPFAPLASFANGIAATTRVPLYVYIRRVSARARPVVAQFSAVVGVNTTLTSSVAAVKVLVSAQTLSVCGAIFCGIRIIVECCVPHPYSEILEDANAAVSGGT